MPTKLALSKVAPAFHQPSGTERGVSYRPPRAPPSFATLDYHTPTSSGGSRPLSDRSEPLAERGGLEESDGRPCASLARGTEMRRFSHLRRIGIGVVQVGRSSEARGGRSRGPAFRLVRTIAQRWDGRGEPRGRRGGRDRIQRAKRTGTNWYKPCEFLSLWRAARLETGAM